MGNNITNTITNRQLGLIGENTATDMLVAKGYKIMQRNYRCKFGEIDVVADYNGKLCFIEVKTRRGIKYGRPCESINLQKKEHIRRSADCYLQELRHRGYVPQSVTFQVVEVTIEHIEDAFY